MRAGWCRVRRAAWWCRAGVGMSVMPMRLGVQPEVVDDARARGMSGAGLGLCMSSDSGDMERRTRAAAASLWTRQTRSPEIGEAGQARLSAARVAIVGCVVRWASLRRTRSASRVWADDRH